jgi:hypothetical protein
MRGKRWAGLRRGPAADAAVAALLALLCTLFFWQVLTPNAADRRWFAAGDFTDQFYAFRVHLARELWAGRLPLWNPYALSGSPFLADIQSAVYYPFGLLTALLAGKGGLPLQAVELEVVVHYFLASFFLYLLVRDLTRSRLAGLVSGLVYAYGSYLSSYPKLQMAILEGQTWVPLALLAVHRAAAALDAQRWSRWATWLAAGGLAMGLSALAGHAQTTLLAGYTVASYLVFTFFPTWQRSGWRIRLALAAGLSILPLVALGLAAAQLLPSLEYMRLSSRAAITFERAGGGFVPSDLLALVLPGLRVIYAGILPLILAITGVMLAVQRRRETAFWAGMAGLALLLSLGRGTVLYSVLYLLAPGFDLFQGQERALQVFALALAILAGYGTATLARPMIRPVKRRYAVVCRVLRWAWVAGVGLVFLAYWGSLYVAQPEPGQVNDLLERSVLLAILLGLSTLLLHYRLRRWQSGRTLGLLVVCLIVLDLFTVNQGTDLGRARARDRFQVTPLVRFLQSQPGPFRIWDEGLLPGNWGTVWELEETGGISPLRLQRYQALMENVPGHIVRWLLNVQFAISRQHELPDGELLSEFSRPNDDFYVYRIEQSGPRATLVYAMEVQPDDALARQRLAAPDLDPGAVAVLAEEPPLSLAQAGQGPSPGAQGTVHLVERLPNRLVLEVDAPSDGLLLLSEVFYPGWQAEVDGQRVSILRAHTILRAVPVEAGVHRVVMVFRPRTVVAGLAISATTLLLVLAWLAWERWKER